MLKWLATTVTPKRNLFKSVFLPALLIFLVAGLALRMAVDPEFRGFLRPSFLTEWMRMGRLMNLAHEKFLRPDDVAYARLSDNAMEHMLDGVDRYSDYLNPDDYAKQQRNLDESFMGYGIEIERHNGNIVITQAYKGSAAYAANLQTGDRIVKIKDTDGKMIELRDDDIDMPMVKSLLSGQEVGNLTLIVERALEGNKTKDSEVTLTRHSFDVPTVRDVELRPDGVGYLHITSFSDNTAEDFANALQNKLPVLAGGPDKPIKGLVLDLRNNTGGLLDAPVGVLDTLLQKGQLVVTTRGRGNVVEETIRTPGTTSVHFAGPVAVLVDKNTASAAEIVAAVLKDTGHAVIVGERTYGKGVVQKIIPLSGGAGLRLTVQAYYLPNGETIQGKGIEPDIVVPLSDKERSLLYFQRSDLRYLGEPERFARTFGFLPQPDPQLETAVGIVLAASRDRGNSVQ